MKYLVLLIIFFTAWGAICPNACSGHGTCEAGTCKCFKQKGLGLNADDKSEGYTGLDCSLRTCPKASQFSPQIFLIDTRGKDTTVGNTSTEGTAAPTNTRLLNDEDNFENENITIIETEMDIKEFQTYKLGGSLICYKDQTKKKIVGYIDVLGYSNRTMIAMKSFIEENYTESNSYCIVKYIRKDLSLFSPISILNTTARGWSSGDFVSLFNNYYGYEDKGYNVNLACIVSKEKGNDQYNEVVEYKAKMNIEDDNIEFEIPVEYPPEGDCFLLGGYNNSYVELESSELYENLLSKVNGRYYFGIKMEQDAVIESIPSDSFEADENGFSEKLNLDFNLINKLDEEDRSTILLALVPGNVLTIIAYPNADTSGPIVRYTVTIVSVRRINSDSSRERERELDDDDNERELQTVGYEIIFTPKISIYQGYTYTLSTRTTEKNGRSVHEIVECSGAGVCNRNTGKCECFNGYDGAACQRMLLCPNNCNNNGKCVEYTKTLGEDNEFDIEKMDSFGFGYDIRTVKSQHQERRSKFFGCLCDAGHRGADCSLYECPSHLDPQKATNVKEKPELEYRDCSGRGICDYATGICQCHDGFAGTACELISSLQ